MDTVFTKSNKEALISPITNIINQSIKEGLFPNLQKLLQYRHTNIPSRKPCDHKQLLTNRYPTINIKS